LSVTVILDKHEALNRTAEALVKAGVGVISARHLHKYRSTKHNPDYGGDVCL